VAEATGSGGELSEPYCVRFQVRDYECDLQGIVNNAVYQNYLEHARHEFLRARGFSFAELTAQGIHLVVVRAELDYRRPLRPGDVFEVRLRCQRSGRMRHLFLQDIVLEDGTVVLTAKIEWTTIDPSGKPRRLDKGLETLFS
jgi:acyl-CoA thioester hydrolase